MKKISCKDLFLILFDRQPSNQASKLQASMKREAARAKSYLDRERERAATPYRPAAATCSGLTELICPPVSHLTPGRSIVCIFIGRRLAVSK